VELSTLQQVRIQQLWEPEQLCREAQALATTAMETEVVIQYSTLLPIQVAVVEQTEMHQALGQSCQVARVAQAAENL
jgi:hypothetical protein